MFKRLRERIAEEAIKFPVGQYAAFGNNPGRPGADPTQAAGVTDNVTEDLITLSDSSSVVVPHTSPQQFSIADEDGPFSEQNTPQKGLGDSSAGSEQFATPTGTGQEQCSLNTEAQNILPSYQPKISSYVPQSDIESEVEEPPTLNLDGISKEQLTTTNQTLKAKLCKFKNKYTEVVRAYKDLHEEKKKIEHALTESQDKALRRIAELREQCQLEQKAKAHLEENLRLILEEKEEMISVLQTKISLLKEEGKANNLESVVEDLGKSSPEVSNKTGDHTAGEDEEEVTLLREKIKKLEALLTKCKNTIKANKDQTAQLLKQKENLSHMLEKKIKELEEIQGKDDNSQTDLRMQLESMQVRLIELEQQQEENSMSMAETKKNMHEELELKEQQLVKSKEEVRQLQQSIEVQKQDINELKKQHEEKINDLQNQLKLTEKTMEEEKQSLMQEFSRGKAAAVTLMQQECGKKMASLEEEWKMKLEEFQKTSHTKEKEMADNIVEKENEIKLIQQDVEEKSIALKELEAELEQHNKSIESSDKKQLQVEKDQALRCSEEKLNFAEANYEKQVEDMKKHASELESENEKYRNEVKELTSLQSQANKEKSELITEVKTKDEELRIVREQVELCKKELESKLVLLKEDLKEKDNNITELRETIRSLEIENQNKLEDAKKRIKQLEHEREQLMIQAQERVSATEAKCREDISHLEEKINKLQLDNTEVDKLRSEINVLNAQLDESLLVAESNQAVAAEEISKIRANLNNVHEELATALDTHAAREAGLLNQVQKLQEENSELQENKKCIDSLKAEKEDLNNKLKELEDQTKNEISILKEENEKLRLELADFSTLKEDKEELNAKIHALELNEAALSSQVEQLRIEGKATKEESSLQQSTTPSTTDSDLQKELISLKEENNLLKERLHILEEIDSNDPNDSAFKQYIDTLKKEYEGRLYAKEAELDSRLKHVIKDFCSQMNIKDKDYDEMFAEIMEKSQSHEERLLREHRLEIASLRQEIFEKDCALEEMHDHYEELVQEKDAKIKEYEKTVDTQKIGSSSKGVFLPDRGMYKTEVSDWDDGWVVSEEAGESSSPIHCAKGDCNDHVQKIESMEEELNKCNSEIKDLRILLRLSPPSSLASNNNYNHSSLHVPEPTEFEYLKNIIFKYMMGKETMTLAKVIAAVLRFNEEETHSVLEKEETRHTMK